MEHQAQTLLIGSIILVIAYSYVFYRIFKSKNNDKNSWKNFTQSK